MKTIWGLVCVAIVATAQFVRAEDNRVTAPPASPAASSAASAIAVASKLTWPATKTPVKRLKESGVPNFGKLNDFVWRSGQPSREGYVTLKSQGMKTVVNLREEFPQDKDLIPEGVKYVYIPIRDEHAPTEEQGKQFMEVVANPENWPVLVHCHGGEGRAGVMSALVRHSFDGWDHDTLMKEVGNFRTKHLGFISTKMPSCQRDFIERWEKSEALTPKQQVAGT